MTDKTEKNYVVLECRGVSEKPRGSHEFLKDAVKHARRLYDHRPPRSTAFTTLAYPTWIIRDTNTGETWDAGDDFETGSKGST